MRDAACLRLASVPPRTPLGHCLREYLGSCSARGSPGAAGLSGWRRSAMRRRRRDSASHAAVSKEAFRASAAGSNARCCTAACCAAAPQLTGHAITGTGVPLACMPACGAVGLVWPCKGSEAVRLGGYIRVLSD